MYGMAEEITRPEFFAGQYEVCLTVVPLVLSPLTVDTKPTSDHFFFYTRSDE